MRIALFDPYLDTLGGGEKYFLTIAEYLSINHEVHLFWDKQDIKTKFHSWGNLNLEKIKIVPNIFLHHSRVSKYQTLKTYDLLFYVTDGSLFFSPAKKNILIIQVPERRMYQQSLLNKLKLRNWKIQLCYSRYVKNIIDPWWGTNLTVLPPPVDIEHFTPLEKENIILSVGRFFLHPHCKKQDFLVTAFRKMVDQGLTNWRLLLCGGADEKGKEYLNKVKNLAEGYPIKIYPNISLSQLKEFYGKASIYWHATGVGEDLNMFPEKAEHFGITTLEAMSAGAVPVVIKAGGQIEIVDDQTNGFFWQKEEELINLTKNLISNKSLLNNISQNAIEKSKDFSKERFCREIEEILDI